MFQGPEFIQFLQHEYLPSLQVAPEISQVNWGGAESPRRPSLLSRPLADLYRQMLCHVTLQELCQVIEQPDVKVLKSYIKVGPVRSERRLAVRRVDCCLTTSSVCAGLLSESQAVGTQTGSGPGLRGPFTGSGRTRHCNTTKGT